MDGDVSSLWGCGRAGNISTSSMDIVVQVIPRNLLIYHYSNLQLNVLFWEKLSYSQVFSWNNLKLLQCFYPR